MSDWMSRESSPVKRELPEEEGEWLTEDWSGVKEEEDDIFFTHGSCLVKQEAEGTIGEWPDSGVKEELLEEEDDICPRCGASCEETQKAVQCDGCNCWYHIACEDVSRQQYQELQRPPSKRKYQTWYCVCCVVGKRYPSGSFNLQKLYEAYFGRERDSGGIPWVIIIKDNEMKIMDIRSSESGGPVVPLSVTVSRDCDIAIFVHNTRLPEEHPFAQQYTKLANFPEDLEDAAVTLSQCLKCLSDFSICPGNYEEEMFKPLVDDAANIFSGVGPSMVYESFSCKTPVPRAEEKFYSRTLRSSDCTFLLQNSQARRCASCKKLRCFLKTVSDRTTATEQHQSGVCPSRASSYQKFGRPTLVKMLNDATGKLGEAHRRNRRVRAKVEYLVTEEGSLMNGRNKKFLLDILKCPNTDELSSLTQP